ncbi:hypothetical protein KP509_1Z258200 [Ceratopteris richardii]|nr:hypothetical protein KP509_1Z258200 [Ceratopteris richardii]
MEDDGFMLLLDRLSEASLMEGEWRKPSPKKRVPLLGSIVSPPLCNIHPHKLDVFIESLVRQYSTTAKACRLRKRNRAYPPAVEANQHIMKRKEISIAKAVMASRRAKAVRQAGMSLFKDPQSIQVKYVRVADDSLPGIAGYATLVRGIWDRITEFL